MRGRRMICFDMSEVFYSVLNQIVALVSSMIVNGHLLIINLFIIHGTNLSLRPYLAAFSFKIIQFYH